MFCGGCLAKGGGNSSRVSLTRSRRRGADSGTGFVKAGSVKTPPRLKLAKDRE